MQRKTITLSLLAGIVILLSAFMPKQQEFKAKNLKVLPKNISKEELDKVMDGFKGALGVKCNFCHAPSKDDPKKMDFSSDDNKHKDIARDMMRMTAKINKKYFHEAGKDGNIVNVACISCHNGKTHPQTVNLVK